MSEEQKAKLKALAGNLTNYINQQYKESKAHTFKTGETPQLMIEKWVKLPKVMADGLEVPGLPFGQITQVYGKKDSGKSTFVMESIVACQQQGILPVLVLTEPKFDINRLAYMGGDPESLIIVSIDNLEEGFKIVERMLQDLHQGFITIENKTGDIKIDMKDTDCFFFWDSIGGTSSTSELEYDIEDHGKDMGRFAQALKKMVKRIWQRLNKVKDRSGILLLNQVWGKRTHTGIVSDAPFGGESVQHYYALEIHLKRGSSISMTIDGNEKGIGYDVTMEVKKNHMSHVRGFKKLCVVAKGFVEKDNLEEFKKEYRKSLKKGK